MKEIKNTVSTGSADSADALVSFVNAGVRRDGRWLVRDVTFDVRRGEIVTLVGPNGGGKTVTAKMALGILSPDEGSIKRAPGLRAGYVPQHFTADAALPLTVERLVTLTDRHSSEEVVSALAATGIQHLAKRPVHKLSGGEFRRAQIARALVRRPELLVLDEPLQGIDPVGETALHRLIGEIRERFGCGVLLVSHDLHLVMAGTDQVVCLNGHVCCSGVAAAVADMPEYRQLFGPKVSETLAIYRHDHDHDHDHSSDGSDERDHHAG